MYLEKDLNEVFLVLSGQKAGTGRKMVNQVNLIRTKTHVNQICSVINVKYSTWLMSRSCCGQAQNSADTI